MATDRNIRSASRPRPRRRRNMRRKNNSNRRRRNIGKSGPSSSTSIGGLIATGVRTLTSFLPGQTVVRPAVDFILKAMGLVASMTFSGQDIFANLKPIGLSANVPLNFGNLMCECKNIGLQSVTQLGMPLLTTNFDTGRIVKMIITAEPTAKYGERSGDWAMALVPVKQVADRSTIADIDPNYEDLKNVPGAKYGPATRSLSLVWLPSVTRDSAAATNQNFGDYGALANLLLAYSQEARNTYGNFSPDAFSVRIMIKTFAHFDERLPITAFTTGSGVVLQPQTVKPRSMYVGTYRGKTFSFSDDHVVSTDGCIKLRVNKLKHPELYQAMAEVANIDSLVDEMDDFSVVS